MTGDTPDTSKWKACHCCNRSYPAEDLVPFYSHPGQAICLPCIAWLEIHGRPIARRLYPVVRLPPRLRGWLSHTR